MSNLHFSTCKGKRQELTPQLFLPLIFYFKKSETCRKVEKINSQVFTSIYQTVLYLPLFCALVLSQYDLSPINTFFSLLRLGVLPHKHHALIILKNVNTGTLLLPIQTILKFPKLSFKDFVAVVWEGGESVIWLRIAHYIKLSWLFNLFFSYSLADSNE